MKFIAEFFEFTDNPNHGSIHKNSSSEIAPDIKEKILSFFKANSTAKTSVLTCGAMDFIADTPLPQTSVIIFEKDSFAWTNEVIYHFEKYNLKLNDDFIQYVLSNS